MIAPNGSQRKLQTVTQWRYCRGCSRSAPMRKVAGDTVWQCPWCGYHEPEPTAAVTTLQTSAQMDSAQAQGAETNGQ